jgi:hypothetical protein
MWLTKQRAQGGNVFGSVDNFEGLAIFIDTYKNDRPGVVFPYIMAMVGDGHTPYDKEHDGKSNELAGCSVCSFCSPEQCQERITNFLEPGPQYSEPRPSNQAQTHLLPRQIIDPLPPTNRQHRTLGALLHAPRREDSIRRVPRFQRRNWRAQR